MLLHYIKRLKWWYVLLISLYFGEAWLGALLPRIFGRLIDNLGEYLEGGNTIHWILLYVGVFFVKKILEIMAGLVAAWIGIKVVKDLRERLFQKILFLPLNRVLQIPVGDRVQRTMSDVESITSIMVSPFINFLSRILSMGWALYFVFKIYPLAGWVLIGVAVPTSIVSWKASRFIYNLSSIIVKSMAAMRSYLFSRFSAIIPLHLFALISEEISVWEEKVNRWEKLALRRSFVQGGAFLIMQALAGLSTGAILFLSAKGIRNSLLTVGDTVTLFQYAQQVLSPLLQLNLHALQISVALASIRRVDEILGEKEERWHHGSYKATGREIRLRGTISFQNVSFSYPGNARVFTELSLEIRAGEHVAIYAPSGRGKSTWLLLLLGIYTPSKGAVLLDGVNIKNLSVWFRKQIGILWQEDFLIQGSVRRNLCLFRHCSDGDLWEVLQEVGLREKVMRLPNGLDSLVGEQGETFSKGERRRLEIARLLLQETPIVVLDEPTSNLDLMLSRKVLSSIKKRFQGKTVVYLTHDLVVQDFVDRYIVL